MMVLFSRIIKHPISSIIQLGLHFRIMDMLIQYLQQPKQKLLTHQLLQHDIFP